MICSSVQRLPFNPDYLFLALTFLVGSEASAKAVTY